MPSTSIRKIPRPRAALVRLLMQEGKKDDAESFLRQTKKDLPDNPEGYRMLGDFYFATGDLDKATHRIRFPLQRPSQRSAG